MLWLAGYTAVSTAYETGISFHFDDLDDRCHDAERDGDSGARHVVRNLDRVAVAACRRNPGGNLPGRGAAAWHGVAGNPCGGADFRSKDRRARGRASWLKKIVPGNRPRMRTGWSNCGVFRRKRKTEAGRHAPSASIRPENFPPRNGFNCCLKKARSKNS